MDLQLNFDYGRRLSNKVKTSDSTQCSPPRWSDTHEISPHCMHNKLEIQLKVVQLGVKSHNFWIFLGFLKMCQIHQFETGSSFNYIQGCILLHLGTGVLGELRTELAMWAWMVPRLLLCGTL